jgi:putative FmdB family regulatory protein
MVINMPIYEYVCIDCGEKFELLRRFSDADNKVKCVKCGKTNVLRAISAFATASSSGACAPSSSGST